jgi:hypothetical protein
LPWSPPSNPRHNFADILTATLKLLEDNEAFPPTPVGRAKQRAAKQPSRRTSKHDPRLSRQDWVRLAAEADEEGRLLPGVYQRRWEIKAAWHERRGSAKTVPGTLI